MTARLRNLVLISVVCSWVGACDGDDGEEGDKGPSSDAGGNDAGSNAGSRAGSGAVDAMNCGAVAQLTTQRSAELGCNAAQDDMTTCETLYRADLCVPEWEALWDCAAELDSTDWQCDQNRELALGDGACQAERDALQLLARAPGAGCLEP